MKDFSVGGGKKWPEKVIKWLNHEFVIFEYNQTGYSIFFFICETSNIVSAEDK